MNVSLGPVASQVRHNKHGQPEGQSGARRQPDNRHNRDGQPEGQSGARRQPDNRHKLNVSTEPLKTVGSRFQSDIVRPKNDSCTFFLYLLSRLFC